MYKKGFGKLFFFYIFFALFSTFSKSTLPTYYLENGISINSMIFGSLLFFLSQIAALLTLKKFSSRLSWYLAVFTTFLSILLVIKIIVLAQFFLAMTIGGLQLFFFFVFYNIAHFEDTPELKRGESSALMFSVGPSISVVAPILAGFLSSINISFLWIFSGLFFLVCIFLVSLQKDFQISYTVKSAFSEIKATRVFIFIEGVWEALVIGIIPVYTLFFIKTPLSYGAFISYLGLVAVVSNILFGRFTDKIQKRSIFLYPSTILMALITFLFPFATTNIFLWTLLSGAISLILPIFWNISTAMVVDYDSNLRLAIPGRELVLGAGRAFGLLLTFISFSIEKSPKYIFLVLGLILLIYPLNLLWNTKIKKNYQYL